jgi:hypothetical protein
MLTRETLREHVEKWSDEVRKVAMSLYDNGVSPEHVLKLAIQIADSKALRAASEQHARRSSLTIGTADGRQN